MTLTTSTLTGVRSKAKEHFVETFLYFAVGDGDTAPTVGDTTLESETFRDERVSVDSTTFPAEVISTGEVGYNDNNAETIAEGGWFDASSGGTLKQRFVLNQSFMKTNDIRAVFPSRAVITVTQQ